MTRKHTIGIRLNDEELTALDTLAGKQGRSRSDMGRILLSYGIGAGSATQRRQEEEEAWWRDQVEVVSAQKSPVFTASLRAPLPKD